jgi:hypothetical protein
MMVFLPWSPCGGQMARRTRPSDISGARSPGEEVPAVLVTGARRVKVLNVVGKDVDEAAGILEAKKFSVVERREESSKPEDTVVDQEPSGGEEADEGSTVLLVVSDGEPDDEPDPEPGPSPPDPPGPPSPPSPPRRPPGPKPGVRG